VNDTCSEPGLYDTEADLGIRSAAFRLSARIADFEYLFLSMLPGGGLKDSGSLAGVSSGCNDTVRTGVSGGIRVMRPGCSFDGVYPGGIAGHSPIDGRGGRGLLIGAINALCLR
jgi:hypothetical protein